MSKGIDRSVAPEINPVREVSLHEAKKFTLNNGVRLHYVEGGDQEVIQLELIYNGGRMMEALPLSAQLAARLLKEGTTSKSAADIAEHIDFHGAHIEAAAAYDQASISLVCLKKHLPNLLPLLQDILTNPTFPDKELAIQQQRSIQQLRVNEEKTDYLAQRLFHQKVFGENHPYGYASSIEKYNALTSSDLANFYHANNSIQFALAAGKIDEQSLQLIDTYLGHLPNNQAQSATEIPLTTQPGTYHQEKENAQQCSIRIGKPMIKLNHPDFAELQVLNVLLGGYFGSRLMSNIREDKGYTYGIYSSLGTFKHTGYWMIGTEVGKEVAKNALVEIYKELERLQNEQVPENELELVKNYIMGSYLSRVDGPFAQAKVHRSLLQQGQTTADFQHRIQNVLQTTPERMLEMANRYFTKQGIVEVVMG